MGGMAGGGGGINWKKDITAVQKHPFSIKTAWQAAASPAGILDTPDVIKAPPVPPSTVVEKDTLQASDEASRAVTGRKGYSSTVITGNLKPKAKGKTTLG
jgi:hypothetical protein